MKAPAKCEGCGYSASRTRQKPGETPEYQACCQKWFCEACREQRSCTGRGDHTPLPNQGDLLGGGVPPNDGIYSAMAVSELTYHSDLESLSSSGARDLMKDTPAQFHFNRHEPRDPKPQYDFGHAAHKMVLGAGGKIAVLDPAIHGLTKDGERSKVPAATAMWKAADAAARAQGKIVVTREQMDVAQRMAGKVFQHPLAKKLLTGGQAEHSIYWHDDTTGVRLRMRFDYLVQLPNGRWICIDYKTALSADPEYFAKAVFEYGYHCQEAWYRDGLAEIGITDVGFVFIVQQKKPPHQVSVCGIIPEHVDLGRQVNRKAIDLFAECSKADLWPSYEPTVHQIAMPGWAVKQTEQLLSV